MKPQHWALIALVAFVLSLGALGYAFLARPPASAPAEAFADKPRSLEEPLWAAPAFAYTSHEGQVITPASLAGKPYVANFIFTTCRTICPLLTAKMVQVQKRLEGLPLGFVSFSVDPEHDTPAALDAYRKAWNPDEPRWLLLATDARTLPATAAGFRITAMKNPTPSDEDPIIHSGVFVLVDGSGMVRGFYDSEHRETFQALLRDARTLAGAPGPPPPTAARSPEALYHELSCAACHENPELAPSLHGLLGKRRELTTAALVTVDRAYLRESILLPELKRVQGYPLRMPSYDGLLSDAELDGLVEYLAALPDKGTAPAEATVAIDPVCHMEVRVTASAISATVDGGVYHFCSEHCRERFTANPGAFLRN